MKRIWVYNRFCSEFTTGQASLREARTFGIQLRIQQRLGLRMTVEEHIQEMLSILKGMHDSFYVSGEHGKRRLLKAMVGAYQSTSDEVIDQRLKDWFDAVHRSKLRAARKERAEQANTLLIAA